MCIRDREKACLDKELEKGDYPVTVHFKAYDEEDNYMGEANAKTVVRILNLSLIHIYYKD